MHEDDVRSLRRIYDAMSREDVEEFVGDVAHDIEWNLPEAVPWGGTRHGQDGMRALAEIYQQHVEGTWADPGGIGGRRAELTPAPRAQF